MKQSERELDGQFRRLLAADRKAGAAIQAAERKSPGTALEPRDCPVCGLSSKGEAISNGCFSFTKCPACALLYMNPCLSDDLVNGGFTDEDPENKEYWDLIAAKALTPTRPKPDPLKHRILRDILPLKSGGRLLDVGCSNGDFLLDAAHFYQVEGLEINDQTAVNARSRGIKVHTRPIEEMPGGNEYDVITLNQLLYGLKQPLNVIREAGRLLKPGGILYVNTPHSESLAMRIYRGRHCHILWKADLNVFNRKALGAAAERAGLRVSSFYTEWTNLYAIDLLIFFLLPGKFVHRRNSFFPFYRKICSLEESLQALLFGNRFEKLGDYCVCVMTKGD